MQRHQLIVAGFGGQGVMAIGKIIAEAAMHDGNHVSWLPSYGPEMRGGTANCNVVVSPEPIISPMVIEPNELIAMNLPSLHKFAPSAQTNAHVFINSSLVKEKCERNDLQIHRIRCNEIALEIGNPKVANMVMLGAYLKVTQAMSLDAVTAIFQKTFIGKKAHFLDLNMTALHRGQKEV